MGWGGGDTFSWKEEASIDALPFGDLPQSCKQVPCAEEGGSKKA